MNSESNTAHPASLLPMLLLALWLLSHALASGMNVTGPVAYTGLPIVGSYAAPFGAVGADLGQSGR